MASAGGKISFALNEVQPGATHFLHETRAARQKTISLDGIGLILVHLLLDLAVLAPKRSKKPPFAEKRA
ncbi:hypothetical protein IZT72_10515 [Pseudomonas brenneri]|uniref:Uncharacterized protein n=1 Tax=Pseudomonas brenneri TaxID=129817 RepID=A0A5B2UQJ3_9PSED|nr:MULTISPECIES: hypothetical protein [Pseudomonas fluorescens group]MBU0938820.1 hypothetical protein [Gammaproteobacteria bacterium]KAA2229293.1 hypothetical protein F1720_16155 [Pseudomonas brenneri]MBF8005037.1 hypothetical protein [Pseudomonas brenneri]TWR76821.1 hypothetical protein FJD34_18585 [Pseudomonas brenneri]WJM92016.1 hypothetical protein QDY63_03595 [Pseudomonas brenneri]